MKPNILICSVAVLMLASCVVEQPVPVTTRTTTTEVVTTGPAVGPVRQVVVTRPPPVVRVEERTLSPGLNYVWTSGYWRWSGSDYVWVPGSWIVRPRPAAVWVEGHWTRTSSGWVFVPGHWR